MLVECLMIFYTHHIHINKFYIAHGVRVRWLTNEDMVGLINVKTYTRWSIESNVIMLSKSVA